MWSDAESKVDYLNFFEIAESIGDIICEPKLLPISIGIFGSWGAGKSTILNLIQQVIEARNTEQKNKFIHINFDAWLFQGYDDARASILEIISDQILKEVKDNASLSQKVKNFAKRINIIRGLAITTDVSLSLVAGWPTFGAVSLLINQLNKGKNIQDILADKQDILKAAAEITKLIKPETNNNPPQEILKFRAEYQELIKEINRPIIIYIDNLDRCTPINAIQTLEAIRLFLFMPNTAFVIATDEDMVRAAVKEYHKGSTPTHHTDYLDKLIQVPVYVPKPGVLETRSYLFMLLVTYFLKENTEIIGNIQKKIKQSLQLSWKEDPVKIEDLLNEISNENQKNKLRTLLSTVDNMSSLLANSSKIMGNPRIIKRLLNVISMRKKVADRRKMGLDESIIMKLAIFERCLDNVETKYLYHLIDKENGKPHIFSQLEKENDSEEDIEWGEWKDENTQKFIKEWVTLEPFLSDIDLRGAAYLSRETLPISYKSKALSSDAKKLVNALMMSNQKTQKMYDLIDKVSKEEYQKCMKEIIYKLSLISNWETRPKGFDGAEILAEKDDACKILFLDFLNKQPLSSWLKLKIERLNK